MQVRLKRPVFVEVVIDAVSHSHEMVDASGRTEVQTTVRPHDGSVAVPLDHEHLPVLTAEQLDAPRDLVVGGTVARVEPPDWIVTSPSGESLPCADALFERLFERLPEPGVTAV
jgi:hypothetical protein